jgi:hypothetical protein
MGTRVKTNGAARTARAKQTGRVARAAKRRAARAAEKRTVKLRERIDAELVVNGVMGRVVAVQQALGRVEVGHAIALAIRDHESTKGLIKDYQVLREITETVLSLEGLLTRDVMLKFAWDGKRLQIYAMPSGEAVEAAGRKVDPLGLDGRPTDPAAPPGAQRPS